MNTKDWLKSGSHYDYEGSNIFYKCSTSSKSQTLILIHGFPTCSWDYYKVWDRLSESFNLITLDFLGYGLSDKPKRINYSTHLQADIVESLLDHLEITCCHVLAHDFGDTVFQELLARDHARSSDHRIYQSAVLLNGGILPEFHHPRPIQKALISPFGILITPFLSKNLVRKNLTQVFGKETPPSDFEIDQLYSLLTRNGGKYVFHKLIRYLTDRKTYADRWTQSLQNASIPLAMINGHLDPVSGKHLVDAVRVKISNMVIYDLPDIGHFPQIEAPDRVLDAFFDFHQKH